MVKYLDILAKPFFLCTCFSVTSCRIFPMLISRTQRMSKTILVLVTRSFISRSICIAVNRVALSRCRLSSIGEFIITHGDRHVVLLVSFHRAHRTPCHTTRTLSFRIRYHCITRNINQMGCAMQRDKFVSCSRPRGNEKGKD